MNTIFLKLLNMSLAAGWLIIAVLVLRLLLKRAPKWLSCTLWAIVAIRLLCPLSLESVFSLIPSAEVFSRNTITESGFQVETGFSVIDYSVNEYLGDHYFENVSVPAARGSSMMTIFSMIWLAVSLALIIHGFLSWFRLRSSVREAIPLRGNIWLCDAVKSPFILGVIRPQIYLSSSTDEEQMPYILAHEHAHLQRKDPWWKLAAYLLLAIYWFHPLIWASYILFCRDIEMACDEKVIKDMNMKQKKAYSHALVSCSIPRKAILACPLAFGENSVKERVNTVLNYKKPAFRMIVAAIAACIAVTVCFLTNPKGGSFDIKIVIPAGSEEAVYYSHEEISPVNNRITLSLKQGIGDTEISLKASDETEEHFSASSYITPGMPVKMNVKTGTWFRIGIRASNPSNEDIAVYVNAKNVEVRISATIDMSESSKEPASETETEITTAAPDDDASQATTDAPDDASQTTIGVPDDASQTTIGVPDDASQTTAGSPDDDAAQTTAGSPDDAAQTAANASGEASPSYTAKSTAISTIHESSSASLETEDALWIQQLWNGSHWDKGTTDCASDCIISVNGRNIHYHSDCGTFNDSENNLYLALDDAAKQSINRILEKYIPLGSVETPIEE